MKTATVKSSDPRGLKRICLSCSNRFYDLNKRPILCPNCNTEYSGETKVKARRGRAASPAEAVPEALKPNPKLREAANDGTAEEDSEEITADADTVSLDEVEALEGSDDDAEEALDMDDEVEDLDVLEDDDDLEEEIAVDKE